MSRSDRRWLVSFGLGGAALGLGGLVSPLVPFFGVVVFGSVAIVTASLSSSRR